MRFKANDAILVNISTYWIKKMDMLKQLIIYLVDQIQDQDGCISKIRIVKLLYLIDVEYYRKFGHTLTNLDWIFYSYGPYAFQINNAINELGYRLDPESVQTRIGEKATIYHVDQEADISGFFNFGTKSMIDKIISHWACEETKSLIDHVYTETEPMKDAVLGEKLDFSKIDRKLDPWRMPSPISLAPETSKLIQERFKKHKESQQQEMPIPAPRYDAVFFEAVKVMDAEEQTEGWDSGSVSMADDLAANFSSHIF